MAENHATSNTTVNTADREKFDISLESPLGFNDIEQQMFVTSRSFCHRFVNPLFKAAYADYIGSIFTVDRQGVQQVVLYFDHKDHGDSITATTKQPTNDDGMVNETILNVRRYTNRVINGDRYYFTNEGKEGLDKFFMNFARKRGRDGSFKIDYGRVKTTTSLGGGLINQPGQQVTQVSFIDPVKIVETVFGTKTAEGHQLEYDVRIINSVQSQYAMMNGSSNLNYLLTIQRLDDNELNEVCGEIGIVGAGLDIVR
jgi:hypothetical protein